MSSQKSQLGIERRLSHALHLLQKTFRDIGIEIEWDRDRSKTNARIITIVCKDSSDMSETSENRNQAQGESITSDESDDTNTERSKLVRELLGRQHERPEAYRLGDG